MLLPCFALLCSVIPLNPFFSIVCSLFLFCPPLLPFLFPVFIPRPAPPYFSSPTLICLLLLCHSPTLSLPHPLFPTILCRLLCAVNPSPSPFLPLSLTLTLLFPLSSSLPLPLCAVTDSALSARGVAFGKALNEYLHTDELPKTARGCVRVCVCMCGCVCICVYV